MTWDDLEDLGTWVVFNQDTGWSDESMRFATKAEADDEIHARESNPDNVMGFRYEKRYEQ